MNGSTLAPGAMSRNRRKKPLRFLPMGTMPGDRRDRPGDGRAGGRRDSDRAGPAPSPATASCNYSCNCSVVRRRCNCSSTRLGSSHPGPEPQSLLSTPAQRRPTSRSAIAAQCCNCTSVLQLQLSTAIEPQCCNCTSVPQLHLSAAIAHQYRNCISVLQLHLSAAIAPQCYNCTSVLQLQLSAAIAPQYRNCRSVPQLHLSAATADQCCNCSAAIAAQCGNRRTGGAPARDPDSDAVWGLRWAGRRWPPASGAVLGPGVTVTVRSGTSDSVWLLTAGFKTSSSWDPAWDRRRAS